MTKLKILTTKPILTRRRLRSMRPLPCGVVSVLCPCCVQGSTYSNYDLTAALWARDVCNLTFSTQLPELPAPGRGKGAFAGRCPSAAVPTKAQHPIFPHLLVHPPGIRQGGPKDSPSVIMAG